MHDDPFIRHFEKSLTILRRIATGYQERSIDGDWYSRTQLDILTLIDDQTERTIKELAELLAMTSGAITQTVETLVRRGLIFKTQDQHDRRFTRLSLTSSGQTAVRKYYQVRSRMLQVLMTELSEAEIETMLRIAKKMMLLDARQAVPDQRTDKNIT
jgi:DNA-binding MarR family transcriptional regulator